jgi:hypothetical protein
MRRYRKSTGRESMRMRRAKSRLSLQKMQNAGTAMGMMAASGVRQGSLVQRAQLSQMQMQNAGVAMGMMAMSGQRDDQGFVGRLRDTFEDLTDMALSGDTGSKEFDDVM